MKKTLLSLALVAASSGALANEIFHGRLSGMAGAGYVTGNYSDGVILNPSLAASYGKDDDFAWTGGAGALGADQDDLLDGLDDLVEFTDYLSANADNLSEADANELIRLMENVDDKNVGVIVGGNVVIAIPNSFLSLALVTKVSGSLGIYADIDEDDYDQIDAATTSPETFDPESLQSSVIGEGVMVTEIGIALAKNISSNEERQILVGITPKKVYVDTIVYTATVANYDEDDFDADDYTIEDDITSMDAGITVISGGLRYGLSISNLNSQKFRTIDDGTFELATRTTAAIGWSKDWLKAEAAMDLNSVPAFGLGGETQMFRAGVEVSPLSWLQLRAGIQRDLEDTVPDAYSLGLGLSPFDVVNIDLVGFSGANEATGAALQFGLRF
jgi:hypothetical protein